MLRDKIIEIFVNVDDFCKEIAPELEKQLIEDQTLGKRNRKAGLCNSEAITLMIAFHYGQFTNLKSFYVHFAQPHLNDLFPTSCRVFTIFALIFPASAISFPRASF